MGAVTEPFHVAARRRRIWHAVVAALLLVAVTFLAIFQRFGQNIDNLGMEALMTRASGLSNSLSLLTHLVSTPSIVVVTVAVAAIAVIRRRAALAVRAVVLVVGANVTTQVLKYLLERPDLGVSFALENSYPSGHTTFAAALGAALVMVVPKRFRSAAAIFGWAWISLMGLVVVSQGWHRPADVIGAILVVAVWAYALAPIELRGRPHPTVGRICAWALVVLGVALLVVAVWQVRGVLGRPLSWVQLQDLTDGTTAGFWFAGAAVALPSGLAAILMSSLDRFSSSRPNL